MFGDKSLKKNRGTFKEIWKPLYNKGPPDIHPLPGGMGMGYISTSYYSFPERAKCTVNKHMNTLTKVPNVNPSSIKASCDVNTGLGIMGDVIDNICSIEMLLLTIYDQ